MPESKDKSTIDRELSDKKGSEKPAEIGISGKAKKILEGIASKFRRPENTRTYADPDPADILGEIAKGTGSGTLENPVSTQGDKPKLSPENSSDSGVNAAETSQPKPSAEVDRTSQKDYIKLPESERPKVDLPSFFRDRIRAKYTPDKTKSDNFNALQEERTKAAERVMDSIEDSMRTLLSLSAEQLASFQVRASRDLTQPLQTLITEAVLLKAGVSLVGRESDSKLKVMPNRPEIRNDRRVNDETSAPSVDRNKRNYTDEEKQEINAKLNNLADLLNMSPGQRSILLRSELVTSHSDVDADGYQGMADKTGSIDSTVLSELGRPISSKPEVWEQTPDVLNLTIRNRPIGEIRLPEDKRTYPHLSVVLGAVKAQEEIARGGYLVSNPDASGSSKLTSLTN